MLKKKYEVDYVALPKPMVNYEKVNRMKQINEMVWNNVDLDGKDLDFSRCSWKNLEDKLKNLNLVGNKCSTWKFFLVLLLYL